MDGYNIIQILSSAYEYTQDQSITQYQDDEYCTSVVTLDMLEKHIKKEEEEVYHLMIKRFDSLINFLQDRKTKNFHKKWSVEVTTADKYNSIPLKHEISSQETLFVMYLSHQKQKNIQRTRTSIENLCEEIVSCSERYFLSEDDYRTAEVDKNDLNLLFRNVFPKPGSDLEFIGTTKCQLDFKDSVIKLIAHFPNFEEGFNEFDKFIQETGGAALLADCLDNLEMEKVKLNRANKTCSFVTPSGMSFSISISKDNYILERDQLITEYLKLDRRVKPLVCALLYFRQRKIVDQLPNLRYLSEMTLIAMVIDFLVEGLKYPLLPNLRDPGLNCAYDGCSFYDFSEESNRHHNCVLIRNVAIGNKYTNLKYEGHKPTIWESHNDDNFGILLKKFFEYYSEIETVKTFFFSKKNNNKSIAIRLNNTVARKDFRLALWKLNDLVDIFSHAFEMLNAGKNFQYICSD